MIEDADIRAATAIVLRRIREEQNLSQEKLSAEANISRSMIDKIERRKRLPSLPILIKLASALQTSASTIVKLIEEELSN